MTEAAGAGARPGTAITVTGFSPLDRILLAVIGVLFAFICYYASIRNLNWDEFHFLSDIYTVARGEAIQPLQTFYVRLFGWLPGLGGDEITQIMAARGFYLALLAAALYFLYRISAHFFSTTAALFAVAVSMSVTNVINHGFSFRYDTLTLALIMFTLFALLKGNLRWWLAAAAATALAMLITIKTVFFLPAILAFALIAAEQDGWSRRVVIRAAASALTAAVVFGGLFLLHLSLLGIGVLGGTAETAQMLVQAGGKTLGEGVLVPRLTTLLRSLVQNPAQWLVILLGILMAVLALRHRSKRWRAAVVLALALPLFTPLVYRNALAYFYVMILPPAAIATGYFVEAFRERAQRSGGGSARLLILAPLIIALVTSAGYYSNRMGDQRIAQRETVELVHALFPGPVPYIDRNEMISSFRKVGFFMSTWGVENYRSEGRPVMAELLRDEAPVFLLANSLILDLEGGGGVNTLEERYLLLDEDFETLKNNFVHFWGILYLAGKHFDFREAENSDGNRQQSFEILVPGRYTLEAPDGATGGAVIDGALVEPGMVIELDRGGHMIEATAGLPEAMLVYGDNPKRPESERNAQPIYTEL